MVIVGEFQYSLDVSSSSAESIEDFLDSSSWLHGDNSELILLVDPHKEGLGVVVVDATSLWPLTLETAGLEVLVTTLEEEMVLDKLGLLLFGHCSESVVFSFEVTIKVLKSLKDCAFDSCSLGWIVDAWL